MRRKVSVMGGTERGGKGRVVKLRNDRSIGRRKKKAWILKNANLEHSGRKGDTYKTGETAGKLSRCSQEGSPCPTTSPSSKREVRGLSKKARWREEGLGPSHEGRAQEEKKKN